MTHTRKSIVTSILLLVSALPAAACIWMDSHNNYLYSLYDRQEFSDRADKVCNANWKAYMGMGDEVEYYYFNMDETKKYAASHGDQLMSSYLENLDLYLNCAREVRYEQWEYPTKEQLAKRRQTLLQVRTYAEGKLKSKLRSQHALLFMRCNMLLGRHAENVSFWEQTATQFIETIYKDMMHDIYAGALLHTGRSDEAGKIFAELGDWQSLMTQYYQRRSYKAISEEYNRDPNSAVLPFLLQDFVNNAQEAVDVDEEGWGVQGKLFIRDIQKSEAMEMCQLARKAVSEKRSKQPVMWQSALAWLEFLFGNQLLARADINRTANLEGTQRMKDCARVLRLYISAATTTKDDAAFDKFLADELPWIDSLAPNNYFFFGAKDRLVHKVLNDHYTKVGRFNTALALMQSVDEYAVKEQIDTMSIANTKKLIDYVHNPGISPIDRYAALQLDDNEMNDLMGTKYMRLCQWKEAKQWLTKVPASFYQKRGYAPYAAFRQWKVEPWIKRQWLKEDQTYNSIDPTMLLANPKLVFSKEMESLEGELSVLAGTSRQQRCYDLAVRYAQTSYTGDCWYLMRDGKSVNDTLRANEVDLLARTRDLLRQASQTADQKLKERALFALSYGELYSEDQTWYDLDWNSSEMKYDIVPRPNTSQYKAFTALANFVHFSNATESDYVSRCDEYKQFKKRLQK